jgi:hypothetical protein
MSSKSVRFDDGDAALARVLVKVAKRHRQEVSPVFADLAKENGRPGPGGRLIIDVPDNAGAVPLSKRHDEPIIKLPGMGL